MSSADRVIRSVPLTDQGVPVDPTLRPSNSAPTPAVASPPAASVPASTDSSDRFDPAKFRDSLPKTETARLASMDEVMSRASARSVETIERTKPKVNYKGKALAPVVYDLDVPFEIDGVDYESVTLTSPVGGKYEDFQAINEEYGGGVVIFWLVLGDLSPEIVEAIHPIDKMAIRELALPFLPRLLRRSVQAEIDEQAAKIAASSTTETAAQE